MTENKRKYKVDVEQVFNFDASKILELNPEINIYFILSYPRSDMGKGNISAHLSKILPNSTIIKYDGLLNTNKDRRHIKDPLEMDDFRIYKTVNKKLKITTSNHILLGELLQKFISTYGEYGHISFRPHFSKYFLQVLFDRWNDLHRPSNLIVEVGGVINDFEVAPIAPYIINYLINKLGSSRIHVILLTECNYSGEDVKTKVTQEAVNQLNSKGIIPEFIFLRLPKEFNDIKLNNEEVREYISKKLEDRCNLFIDKNQIGLIPYWSKENLYKYNYLISKTMNIGKIHKIFIGSKNKGKISDWRRYFINFDIVDPYQINKIIEVKETRDSIFENARIKAKKWSEVTDLVTICDDTGFFITALDKKPGVSVKTFGGELNDSRTDVEYIKYVFKRTRNLKDKTAYFQSAIAFARRGEIVMESSYKIEGELCFDFIDFNNVNVIEEGYPIGMIWKPKGSEKVWSLLSDAEKIAYDSSMIEVINKSLDELFI